MREGRWSFFLRAAGWYRLGCGLEHVERLEGEWRAQSGRGVVDELVLSPLDLMEHRLDESTARSSYLLSSPSMQTTQFVENVELDPCRRLPNPSPTRFLQCNANDTL